MKPLEAATPARLGALAATVWLAGCTITSQDGLFSGDKVDYRSGSTKTAPLEVPPDLTQLARESRYQPQGGVVSAAAAGAQAPAAVPAAAAAATAAPSVALTNTGGVRVERAGQQRWLVAPQTPEQLWPQVKGFWEQRGFTIAEEDAKVGVMETNWAENRAKLPADAARNVLGRLLGNLYDTGERDRFRTRIERTPTGSEIYITHRGAEEVYASERKDSTVWKGRNNDPQLEAEFLSRLMVALGTKDAPTAVAIVNPASAPAAAAAPTDPVARAQAAAANTATSLTLDEPFDRAWRRVGLALDRSGFTVEDRDRAAGLYYVRYVDPKNAGKEEPGWWARLFGDRSNPQEALRYRVAVKGAGGKSTVSVQRSNGEVETGDNAQRIVGLLMTELK